MVEEKDTKEKSTSKKKVKAVVPKLEGKLEGIRVNKPLLHEIVVALLSNKRRGNAHAKTKSEVSGGGRKPWRQKGTGRARAGSSRSPLWRGGGVTHGPSNEVSYQIDMPKKKKRTALKQVIVQRINEKNLKVIDSISLKQPKTKIAAELLKGIFERNGKILFLLGDSEIENARYFRNLKNVTVKNWRDADLLGFVNNEKILYSQEAWDGFIETRIT